MVHVKNKQMFEKGEKSSCSRSVQLLSSEEAVQWCKSAAKTPRNNSLLGCQRKEKKKKTYKRKEKDKDKSYAAAVENVNEGLL